MSALFHFNVESRSLLFQASSSPVLQIGFVGNDCYTLSVVDGFSCLDLWDRKDRKERLKLERVFIWEFSFFLLRLFVIFIESSSLCGFMRRRSTFSNPIMSVLFVTPETRVVSQLSIKCREFFVGHGYVIVSDSSKDPLGVLPLIVVFLGGIGEDSPCHWRLRRLLLSFIVRISQRNAANLYFSGIFFGQEMIELVQPIRQRSLLGAIYTTNNV